MDVDRLHHRFPTNLTCVEFLETIRWRGKPICPYCQLSFTTSIPKERRHRCNSCHSTFSVTVGTLFHQTRLPLKKWFIAICHVAEFRGKVSARKLALTLKVNKNTAWRVASCIQKAEFMERGLLQKIREELL